MNADPTILGSNTSFFKNKSKSTELVNIPSQVHLAGSLYDPLVIRMLMSMKPSEDIWNIHAEHSVPQKPHVRSGSN